MVWDKHDLFTKPRNAYIRIGPLMGTTTKFCYGIFYLVSEMYWDSPFVVVT